MCSRTIELMAQPPDSKPSSAYSAQGPTQTAGEITACPSTKSPCGGMPEVTDEVSKRSWFTPPCEGKDEGTEEKGEVMSLLWIVLVVLAVIGAFFLLSRGFSRR